MKAYRLYDKTYSIELSKKDLEILRKSPLECELNNLEIKNGKPLKIFKGERIELSKNLTQRATKQDSSSEIKMSISERDYKNLQEVGYVITEIDSDTAIIKSLCV